MHDLEKGASRNHASLRTWIKCPILLTEDWGRRVEDGKLMLAKEDLR